MVRGDEVTEIRPLQHADLPRVADLLATMFPVWTAHVWQQFLRATLLENPWTDDGAQAVARSRTMS